MKKRKKRKERKKLVPNTTHLLVHCVAYEGSVLQKLLANVSLVIITIMVQHTVISPTVLQPWHELLVMLLIQVDTTESNIYKTA